MNRSIAYRIALLALCVVGICCNGRTFAAEVTSLGLIDQYNTIYRKFIVDFRAEQEVGARLALIKSASDEINELFAENLQKPLIANVLPVLEHTKLLDLEPTFMGVIEGHRDADTRALAMLMFAHHSGNNGRRKICITTLNFLKEQHGSRRYKKATFAEQVEESIYFYENLSVGCPAPPTVGEDSDGEVFRLADYRGKVVMLRFWGNWCPACRRMFPYERKLVQKYKNQPFALIGVNSDSLAECKRAQRMSNLTWRTFWEGGTTHGAVASVFRVENWPTIFVIDANGIIRYRTEGLDERKLDLVLERLIKEAKQPEAIASPVDLAGPITP